MASLNWHWSPTTHTSLIYRAGSSSPPSELTAGSRLKAERVNTQFVYVLPGSCGIPSNLDAANISTTTADVSWDAVDGASSYNWAIVAAGAGSGGTAMASGTTESTTASATGLSEFTAYDLHVQADCGGGDLGLFSTAYNFTTASSSAQTSVSLGDGTSSSATRGPFQRSDSGSSSVYSRANLVYTQAELVTTLGIGSGSTITQINWDLGSTNQITASGDATLNVYMKNSSVTEASAGFWTDIIEGQNLVGTYTFNITNNFPGEEGFMAFPLDNNFVYEGNTIEIAVEWDCSGLVAADPDLPNLLFSGNGSLNWHWSPTEHLSLIYRAGSSSPPSELTAGSRLKAERVNTQFVYVLPPCVSPTNLNADNLTTTTADLSWDAVGGASSYNWVVVAAGDGTEGTAVASGTTMETTAQATGLSSNTSYDLHVQADCDGEDISTFSLAYNFTTACPVPTGLASSNIASTTADFSWGTVDGASSYNWIVVATGDGAEGTAVASGTSEGTMVSATGLTSSTSYDLHVQAMCGEDNVGDFSAAHNFITSMATCPTPMGLASSNITQTTADLSWDAVEGASSYTWTVMAADDCLADIIVASGTTTETTASASDLTGNTSYNLQVQADCGNGNLSDLSATYTFTTMGVSAPMLLSADGPGGTYDLMIAALGPDAEPLEPPDCNHLDFETETNNTGEHIDEVFDADLGKDVFRFHLHVTPDNDRCINFDRQRNEIKTYSESPDNLLGVLGETVEYKWKFKLPEGFQSSARFTHIHQLKSVGASNSEDDMPQITFTTRKGTNGNPDQLELRYAETLTQITWAQTDLTPFKGEWVEATETVTYGDWGEGVYDLVIRKVSDCSVMFSYSNDNTRMWKTNADFVRPKWGIYRSLENMEDLRDEEVLYDDFSIKELSNTPDCPGPPINLNATNVSFFSATLSWNGVPGASLYNWKVVEAGAGSGAIAVEEGTAVNTTISLTGLMDNTSYDLYVEADCGGGNTTGFSEVYNFTTEEDTGEVTTDPLGTETSSSSSRGPIHQAGTGASTRYSRFFHVFTQEQLSDIGLIPNSSITELQWYITTNDVIVGAGEAPFKIYIRNSSATEAMEGSWATAIMDATLVLDRVFNETDNFPAAEGWMPFAFDEPFEYTGGGLEIGVEFNWASVAFTNNGTIKWRYSNYPNNVMVRALSTAADGDYKDNMTLSSTGMQRANMRVVYIPTPVPCPAPTNLNAANITTSSADLSWDEVEEGSSYTWKVVAGGAGSDGTAVAEGTTEGTTTSVTDLSPLTSYDLHVQTDCGDDLSIFSAPYTFVTLPGVMIDSIILGDGQSHGSAIGPIHQGGITANTRYSRYNQVYTQEELLAAGIAEGDKITQLQWSVATPDVISVGQAPFTVYIKNSDVTEATPVDWFQSIASLDPVVDIVLDVDNNFPGEASWMPFTFDEPFTYTGGALEVLVQWNWDNAAFTNDEKVRWHYTWTPVNTVVRSLGSGSYSNANMSFSTSTSSPPNHRANMKIVYVPAEFVNTSNIDEETPIKIYPNPLTGELTIEDFEGLVVVYNLLGQPLKAFAVTRQKEQLSLGDLHPGVYLLEMKGKDGSKRVQQIVKAEQ